MPLLRPGREPCRHGWEGRRPRSWSRWVPGSASSTILRTTGRGSSSPILPACRGR